jgi:hypothetical protein
MCYACGFSLVEVEGTEADAPVAPAPELQAEEPVAQPAEEASEDIHCPECGNLVTVDAEMCYVCGHKFGEEGQESGDKKKRFGLFKKK